MARLSGELAEERQARQHLESLLRSFLSAHEAGPSKLNAHALQAAAALAPPKLKGASPEASLLPGRSAGAGAAGLEANTAKVCLRGLLTTPHQSSCASTGLSGASLGFSGTDEEDQADGTDSFFGAMSGPSTPSSDFPHSNRSSQCASRSELSHCGLPGCGDHQRKAASCHTSPCSVLGLTAQVEQLRGENQELRARLESLEGLLRSQGVGADAGTHAVAWCPVLGRSPGQSTERQRQQSVPSVPVEARSRCSSIAAQCLRVHQLCPVEGAGGSTEADAGSSEILHTRLSLASLLGGSCGLQQRPGNAMGGVSDSAARVNSRGARSLSPPSTLPNESAGGVPSSSSCSEPGVRSRSGTPPRRHCEGLGLKVGHSRDGSTSQTRPNCGGVSPCAISAATTTSAKKCCHAAGVSQTTEEASLYGGSSLVHSFAAVAAASAAAADALAAQAAEYRGAGQLRGPLSC